MFYDSECDHCNNLLKELKQWFSNRVNNCKLDIITVAVDNEKETWKEFTQNEGFSWPDVWVRDGINSKAAKAYYVLAMPTLIVIDDREKIIGLPKDIQEVERIVEDIQN